MTPALCAVAGCLFEVHLPRPPGTGHWTWSDPRNDAVTLLAEHLAGEPPDRCRFRFRAERPGDVTLVFRAERAAAAEERLTLHITPEIAGD